MTRIAGTKNSTNPPDGIEAARKMARIKAHEAAPVWGLDRVEISRYCNRGEIPGAVKLGRIWYVTPAGMDKLFEAKKNRVRRQV